MENQSLVCKVELLVEHLGHSPEPLTGEGGGGGGLAREQE